MSGGGEDAAGSADGSRAAAADVAPRSQDGSGNDNGPARRAPDATASGGRAPRKTLAVDGQRLGSTLHHIAGDRDHAFEHALDAARARPWSEIASRACEPRAVGAHTGHNPRSQRRRSATVRYSSRGARAERFTCRPNARITIRRTRPACRATTVRAAVHLHAERRGTCSARACEPRSTPKRACFTPSPEATLACAAREVKLYLAVPSPSSSRLALPSLTVSSSSVLGRARFRGRRRTLGGPAPGRKTGRSWASPTTTD